MHAIQRFFVDSADGKPAGSSKHTHFDTKSDVRMIRNVKGRQVPFLPERMDWSLPFPYAPPIECEEFVQGNRSDVPLRIDLAGIVVFSEGKRGPFLDPLLRGISEKFL